MRIRNGQSRKSSLLTCLLGYLLTITKNKATTRQRLLTVIEVKSVRVTVMKHCIDVRSFICNAKHRLFNTDYYTVLSQAQNYTWWPIKTFHCYFCDSFGKCRPPLIILSRLYAEMTAKKAGIKSTTWPQIRCCITL